MNGQRPLFYHAGCCRHAAHGVGDGGDDKEENSFSDWRRYRHQKGEADNSRHGFLYLYHPIYYVLLQVTPTANRNSVTFPLRAGDLRFRVAAACGLAALCRRGVHHPLLCPALPALLFATPLLLLASPAPPPASRRLSRSIAMPALRSAPSQLDAKSPPSSLGLR